MIVVSWNVRETLRRCLTAALKSQGCTPVMVVVDNDSRDGSADMVAQEFPKITLIRNSRNQGFAAAVNQGLAHRRGHVLLLNPDVELQPNTIATMLPWMLKLPRVGILGPRLIYTDGTIQPSVKRFPKWIDLALVLSKLPNVLPGLARQYQAQDIDLQKTQEVDQVMGSCFLIRQETLDTVGAFDEKFWIWYEEVDFSLRAKQAGWTTLFVAEAQATHGRARSFQQVSTVTKQRYLRNSARYYVRKHFGPVAAVALWPFMAVSWLSAWVIDLAKLQKPSVAKDF